MRIFREKVTVVIQEDLDIGVDRLERWRRGEKPGPREVMISPTNRCNLRCKMCWARESEEKFGKALYSAEQELSDERLLELVDECAEMDVRSMILVGGGEPMLRHDAVMAMCERISSHGIRGAIHSNGTLFKPEDFERLIDMGWDELRVSLDGHDRATNDYLRGSGFERATKNIRTLVELRRKRGVSRPAVSLHSVITNTNYRVLDKIVELAHELECCAAGMFFLLEANDACAALDLDEEQRKELPAYLNKATETAERFGIKHAFDTLLPGELYRSRDQDFSMPSNLGGDLVILGAHCFEVWLGASVFTDGKVGPCCVAWEERAPSLHTMSFREAWESDYFEEVRERITRNDVPEYCANCPTHLIARTRDMRRAAYDRWGKEINRSAWAAKNAAQRLNYVVNRLAANLRDRGLRETLHRGREWVKIQRG